MTIRLALPLPNACPLNDILAGPFIAELACSAAANVLGDTAYYAATDTLAFTYRTGRNLMRLIGMGCTK
jgi:hypothetical protein